MPTENLELVTGEAPNLESMQRADLPAIWEGFREQLMKLKSTAETLQVTSVDQKDQMKLARATRLTLRELRIEIEKKRKELVEDALRRKQRIDADAKELKDLIEPLEARLLEQEQFVERETIRIEDEKRVVRTAELTPLLCAPIAVDIGKMPDVEYAALLADVKSAHTARLERERKEEEARVAAAKAEAEERERIRLENERLKKEAAEREESARAERKKLEAAAKVEREAAVAVLEREKNRAKAAQDKAERLALETAKENSRREAAAAAEAKKEREAIKAKAKAEREAAEAVARQERDAREKAEAELKARQDAEAAAKMAEEAAAKKAALAPDKEKLVVFAAAVRALVAPTLSSPEGAELAGEVAEQIARFAAWIEKKAAAL